MMSFLQNVLQRHQLGSASQPANNTGLPGSYIVQLRPQSRFENDQGAFAQTHEGRHDEPLRAAPAEPESGSGPTPPLRQSPTAVQPATIGDDPGSGREWREGIDGRMDTVIPSFSQKPFEHQPFEHNPAKQQPVQQQTVQKKADGDHAPSVAITPSVVAPQSFPQAAQSTEPRRAVSQEPARPQYSQPQAQLSNEVNQRIEAILQAFNRRQTHTASRQAPLEPRQPITITSAAQNRSEAGDFRQPVQALSPGSTDQPVPAARPQTTITPAHNRALPNTEDPPHLGLLGQASMSVPTSATAEPTQQREETGALQIPDWLGDIQAGFHNRWRELDQQVESEPVVNVTIGRVEVRAVQEKHAKPAQARKGPSGVMSLDAYLKQRNRRGPA